jgi:iron complex transport system substrate-binding protein
MTTRTSIRRLGALALGVVLTASLAACSGDDEPTATTAGSSGSGAGASSELGRVVALGEEFLLADLLALGVTPVASTATVVDSGFQGLDQFDTDEITPISATEPNLERLASFRPDTIVTSEFVAGELGLSTLEQLADQVVVAPDGGGADSVAAIAEQLGLEAEADELLAELDAAREAAAGATTNCTVSLATIYAGPTPAVWIGGPNNVALALEDIGCTLQPGGDDLAPDPSSRTAGRVYLSLEQLGLLDAPQMILLQTDTVDGERSAIDDLASDPLWQQLPAVEADAVEELDRLGYPGVAGQIRLYEDLIELVGGS